MFRLRFRVPGFFGSGPVWGFRVEGVLGFWVVLWFRVTAFLVSGTLGDFGCMFDSRLLIGPVLQLQSCE